MVFLSVWWCPLGSPMLRDWPQTSSYLPRMSVVVLLPAWGRVNLSLYRLQSNGASIYPATVEPLLDSLGGKASWVPPGHTLHSWPCQFCCWWTLMTTCYYRVTAFLWSYRALIFAWLVGIGCSACRSGLVHLCWCVCPSDVLHTLDPLLSQVPGVALVLWSVCNSQTCCAYLLIMLHCVYTASFNSGQSFGGVRPWSCWWLACSFMAAQFIQYSPCYSEFAEFWYSCKGPWWYMALLFGAGLWCGSCLVRFLGSGVFFSPACVWVDIPIVTGLVPSYCLRVSVYCCSHQGPWSHFYCTQGPQCPTRVLSPPCSALFRASCHSTWWWTMLAFVTRDHCALGRHLGIHKTLYSLLRHFLWPGLLHEVSAFMHGAGFSSGRRTWPLPLLVCCSQLTNQLSIFQYGLWISLQTYHSAGCSMVCLLLWISWPNGSS